MNLYQINLPHHRQYLGLDMQKAQNAHKAFRAEVRRIVGDLTRLPTVQGEWLDLGGRVYEDQCIPYQIACTSEEWREIVTHAFRLFPDQLAIFHAQIGVATIELRKKPAASSIHI